MKKVLLTVAAAAMLTAVSCNKNEEDEDFGVIDWYPITVSFFVVDYGQYTNFVADNYNDIVNTTTLTYQGKDYKVGQTLQKYYMPFFEGLHVDSSATKKPFFCFGELDGAHNYDDDFIISFADGSADTVHFKRVHKGGLKVDDTWYLNGEKHSGSEFILFRQRDENGKLKKLYW